LKRAAQKIGLSYRWKRRGDFSAIPTNFLVKLAKNLRRGSRTAVDDLLNI
jgi:hypothetical protein